MDWGVVSHNRVALVDDDPFYLDVIAEELGDCGFSVRGFSDGATFLEALDVVAEANAVLLDWTLPGLSGVDILERVRWSGLNVPVAILTGRAPIDYERIAFEKGAVDFIDKTRGVEIIAKRLTRMIETPMRNLTAADLPVTYGPMTFRRLSSRAEWRGYDVKLTLTEYNVVSLLAANPGSVVTYRGIYDRMHYAGFLGGTGDNGYWSNVRSAVKRIRRKFMAIDSDFTAIINHAGVGYSWLNTDASPGPRE
jgi:two-component system, OmpR family, response regulator ChvI